VDRTFIVAQNFNARQILAFGSGIYICIMNIALWPGPAAAPSGGPPRTDLAGADLRGANLSCAALDHADLRDADLRGATLDHADLRGADLRGANLRDAVLLEADLRRADLSSADLHDAVLSNADLSDAILCHADLFGANLRGADLQHANLSEADLRRADLSDAILLDANLAQLRLACADLTNALYAPESDPPNPYVAGIEGLSTVRVPSGRETGLVQLRTLLRDAGLYDLADEATHSIRHRKIPANLQN
jgi:uncharacterized protein YjbI with pentapeptide repeats